MSVDERLRRGLAANTAHLQPSLNSQLGALLGRAQRRRRARRSAFGLCAAGAAVVGVFWSGPLDSHRVTLDRAVPAPHRSATVTGPTLLETMSGALPPGTYAAKLPHTAPELRAVVEVPDGFITDGAYLYLADHGESTGLRAVAFWAVA